MSLPRSSTRGVQRLIRCWKGPVLAVLASLIAALAASAAPAAAATVPATADLAVVAIRPNVTLAAQGMTVIFTEVTRNNGPDPSRGGMDVSQTVTGGTIVGTECDLGVSTEGGGVCEYNLIAPGQVVRTKLFIKVTATTGTLTVRGNVFTEDTSVAVDPNPANNSAVGTVKIVPPADLSLRTASDLPDPVVLGSRLTYTLVASNAGPHAASGVTVRDRLPAEVTLVSATASQGGGCTHTTTAPVTVTCSLGTLASGGHATIRLVVRPTGPANLPAIIRNRATISSTSTADPAPDNNTATAATTVVG